MVLEIVPSSVGMVSRAWGLQEVDLEGAARQIARAGSGGFTPAVAGAAARFLDSWSGLAAGLGREAESHRDRLQRAVTDYLDTDEATCLDLVRLGLYVDQVQ